jgi:hypothetical protein
MSEKKVGEMVAGALVGVLRDVAVKAVGAAVESVLEDVSKGLQSTDEKVARTRRKVAKTTRRRKVIDVEVVDAGEKRH